MLEQVAKLTLPLTNSYQVLINGSVCCHYSLVQGLVVDIEVALRRAFLKVRRAQDLVALYTIIAG